MGELSLGAPTAYGPNKQLSSLDQPDQILLNRRKLDNIPVFSLLWPHLIATRTLDRNRGRDEIGILLLYSLYSQDLLANVMQLGSEGGRVVISSSYWDSFLNCKSSLRNGKEYSNHKIHPEIIPKGNQNAELSQMLSLSDLMRCIARIQCSKHWRPSTL